MLFNALPAHPQQLDRALQKKRLRQIDVPLLGGLLQHIEQAAANAEIRICVDPHPARDLVGDTKTDAINIIGHPIGIFFDHLIELRPVCVVDPHTQGIGNSILLQEDHGLAHILLFLHLLRDLPGLSLADSLYLRQAFRLLLDDAERIGFKLLYDPCRQSRSHSLNGAGAQIPLNGKDVLRRFNLIGRDHKLPAVGAVLLIAALGLYGLPLTYVMQRPHTGDLLIFTDQDQHGITVLTVPVDDVIYIPFYSFHVLSFSLA